MAARITSNIPHEVQRLYRSGFTWWFKLARKTDGASKNHHDEEIEEIPSQTYEDLNRTIFKPSNTRQVLSHHHGQPAPVGILLKKSAGRSFGEDCPDTHEGPKPQKRCPKWNFKILPEYNIKKKLKEIKERKRKEKGLPPDCET